MGSGESPMHDVKIVVGNKALMGEEGITISKSVDEYMRDMEVINFPSWQGSLFQKIDTSFLLPYTGELVSPGLHSCIFDSLCSLAERLLHVHHGSCWRADLRCACHQ